MKESYKEFLKRSFGQEKIDLVLTLRKDGADFNTIQSHTGVTDYYIRKIITGWGDPLLAIELAESGLESYRLASIVQAGLGNLTDLSKASYKKITEIPNIGELVIAKLDGFLKQKGFDTSWDDEKSALPKTTFEDEKSLIDRNHQILTKIINGSDMKSISSEYQLSPGRVQQLFWILIHRIRPFILDHQLLLTLKSTRLNKVKVIAAAEIAKKKSLDVLEIKYKKVGNYSDSLTKIPISDDSLLEVLIKESLLKDIPNSIMNTTIVHANFSVRAKNALKAEQIQTIGQLLNTSTRHLIHAPNLGAGTLKDIVNALIAAINTK